ncbi:MAG: hypothetical protein HC865_10675 [Cyanobacteria bacterium RU_5_0]|nr:hypothetical protein [Cyanobacteria bacterium RU_5_0]
MTGFNYAQSIKLVRARYVAPVSYCIQSTCKFSVDGCRGVGAIPVWLPWIRGQTHGSAPTDRKINKKLQVAFN